MYKSSSGNENRTKYNDFYFLKYILMQQEENLFGLALTEVFYNKHG